MYSKIAFENVRKSFKDYTVYFLTLTFAVCIFYSFNSIESQKAVLQMSESQAGYMDVINQVISMLSVFIAIILGSLIIYANNFLIKKRKKELGVYMTLGMSKRRISGILVQETFLVGVLSLAAGLLLGVMISQGLSVFTAQLFKVGMSEFKFIISIAAIFKTILFFGLIFLLVMLFNTRTIAKYELIDLLMADRKSEEIKVKNRWVALFIFIIGVSGLGAAYALVLKVGVNFENPLFKLSIGLGVVGTFLFFYGLAGFVLAILQSTPNLYLKNLNIFVSKQISRNINTNFISMSLISLMLFLTISGLSTGVAMKNSLESGIVAPFDASAYLYTDEEDEVKSVKEAFERLNFDFGDNQVVYFDEYRLPDLKINQLLMDYTTGTLKENLQNGYWENISVLKESDYNQILALQGEPTIDLKNQEVLVTSNFQQLKEALSKFLKEENMIQINHENYFIQNKTLIPGEYYNSGFSNNILTLIVPDKVVEGLVPTVSYADIKYGQNPEQSEKQFSKLFDDFQKGDISYGDYQFFMMGYTQQQTYEQNRGMSSLILYVGLYIGVVFLISSAAVLALQQLSEASDSLDRYKSLKKIGATQKMINKTIFHQILIYFIIPLILGIVDSIFGILVVNDFIKLYGESDIVISSLITMLMLIIIYGGYFFTTYVSYKSIVKNAR